MYVNTTTLLATRFASGMIPFNTTSHQILLPLIITATIGWQQSVSWASASCWS